MGNSLIIFHLKMFTHVATAAVLAAVSVPELEQFLGGLFFGLLQDDHLDKIKLCLADAKSVESEMLEAVADIQKKDLMDMIKATKIIGTIVTQFMETSLIAKEWMLMPRELKNGPPSLKTQLKLARAAQVDLPSLSVPSSVGS